VCGEETAAHAQHEGRRGMPRVRPPYPSVKALWGITHLHQHNVETLANVPGIMKNRRYWFSSVGTATSKGTKVFALSGKVVRTGLVEVAMAPACATSCSAPAAASPTARPTRRCRSAARRAAAFRAAPRHPGRLTSR